MKQLGFDRYIENLELYYAKYQESAKRLAEDQAKSGGLGSQEREKEAADDEIEDLDDAEENQQASTKKNKKNAIKIEEPDSDKKKKKKDKETGKSSQNK